MTYKSFLDRFSEFKSNRDVAHFHILYDFRKLGILDAKTYEESAMKENEIHYRSWKHVLDKIEDKDFIQEVIDWRLEE